MGRQQCQERCRASAGTVGADLALGLVHADREVGQGAFGDVYRAFDTKLQREVALKLLRPRGDSDHVAAATLLREARAMARVRHPNIVPIYGVDTHEGRAGFWSDFVRGQTLSGLLAAHGPFSPRETALIGVDVCRAVGAAHRAGLLHRDVKTENVMREEGGRILLMDFGLCVANR
jgi:serine/threonine protein kinase